MSKYRCPLCGASHKQDAERCRLCGQSMTPGAVAVHTQQVAQPLRTTRGTKGLLFIGLGLVVALILGAVAFGVVKENSQIRQAKSLVTGPADGWTTLAENEGGFTVEMPDQRTRGPVAFAATDDHQLMAWKADMGGDTEIVAGWGKVAPPSSEKMTITAMQQYLRYTVAPRWVTGNGLEEVWVSSEETGVAGLPAFVFHTTQPKLKLGTKEAFGHVVFAYNGSTLYVLQVLTIYKDAPQLNRLASSFVVTR